MLQRTADGDTLRGGGMARTLKYLGVAAVMTLGQWLLTGAGAEYVPPGPGSKGGRKKALKNKHLDPEGEPAEFAKKAGPLFAVWRDRTGWHLRIKADRRAHHFKGLVRVEGGVFERVTSYRGEKVAPAAHWKLQKNKQEL